MLLQLLKTSEASSWVASSLALSLFRLLSLHDIGLDRSSALRKHVIINVIGTYRSSWLALFNDCSIELQSIDQDLKRNSARTNTHTHVRVWRQ